MKSPLYTGLMINRFNLKQRNPSHINHCPLQGKQQYQHPASKPEVSKRIFNIIKHCLLTMYSSSSFMAKVFRDNSCHASTQVHTFFFLPYYLSSNSHYHPRMHLAGTLLHLSQNHQLEFRKGAINANFEFIKNPFLETSSSQVSIRSCKSREPGVIVGE